MFKLAQNNDQISYKNNKIFFKKENCEKNTEFMLENLLKIEKEIIVQLKLLIQNLQQESFPINDQVMIFDLKNLNLIKVNLDSRVVNQKAAKGYIQFFTALFLLNFAFYIVTRVKFNLK